MTTVSPDQLTARLVEWATTHSTAVSEQHSQLREEFQTRFPLDTLPGYLQPIGWISPLWHAAELGRAALYGAPLSAAMAALHVGFLVLVALVAASLSIRTFRRRLDS